MVDRQSKMITEMFLDATAIVEFHPPSRDMMVDEKPDVKAEKKEIKHEKKEIKHEKSELKHEKSELKHEKSENEDEKPESSKAKRTLNRKVFATRKKPSIRAKERRVRQNRRLKKSLVPKNAVMALHEVKGITMGDFQIIGTTGGFTVNVNINNTQYEGQGTSKNAAKNDACEKALRDIIIARMHQNKDKKPEESAHSSHDASDADQEMKDYEDDENDIPMINLASFALYKLFTDWEHKGYSIPLLPNMENGGENGNGDKPKKDALPRTELPDNWNTLHPATLLCHMRPGVSYVNLQPEGEKPNLIQRVSITVDSQQFIGVGRSKKCARKNAAVLACNALFRTRFIPETYSANVI